MGHRDHLRRLRRTARDAGLAPVEVEDSGVKSEPKIEALVGIMRRAGFSDEMVAERVAFWRRHNEAFAEIDEIVASGIVHDDAPEEYRWLSTDGKDADAS